MAAGIPAGPINNIADVFADPQVKHCGLVEEIEHAELGTLKQVGNPVRMDGLQGLSIRRPPPSLGEHTLELLSELGLSASAIAGLVERKVVFQMQIKKETVK